MQHECANLKEKLHRDQQSYEKRLEEMMRSFEVFEAQKHIETQETSSEFQQREKQLNLKIFELEQKCESQIQRFIQLEEELVEREKQLCSESEEREKMEVELNAVIDRLQLEKQQLSGQIEKYKNSLDLLQHDLNNSKKEYLTLQSQVGEFSETEESLRVTLERMAQEREELSLRHGKIEEELRNKLMQAQYEKDREVERIGEFESEK